MNRLPGCSNCHGFARGVILGNQSADEAELDEDPSMLCEDCAGLRDACLLSPEGRIRLAMSASVHLSALWMRDGARLLLQPAATVKRFVRMLSARGLDVTEDSEAGQLFSSRARFYAWSTWGDEHVDLALIDRETNEVIVAPIDAPRVFIEVLAIPQRAARAGARVIAALKRLNAESVSGPEGQGAVEADGGDQLPPQVRAVYQAGA